MPSFDTPSWLEGRRTVGGEELARVCGLTAAELDELVDYGSLIAPTADGFQADVVTPLREAVRVRALFDLDLFTAGLLLQYLRKIEQLECEVRRLRGRLAGNGADREIPAAWRSPQT